MSEDNKPDIIILDEGTEFINPLPDLLKAFLENVTNLTTEERKMAMDIMRRCQATITIPKNLIRERP